MAYCMGLDKLVAGDLVMFKRKFRWVFEIPDITPEGTYAIPAIKSARPTYTFKEHGVQHLNEEIFFPMKADWKPINLTLYDIGRIRHPIVEWIAQVYRMNPDDTHKWYPSVEGEGDAIPTPFKRNGRLTLYDGCGGIMERWKFENMWPQSVDFSELDYGSSDIVLCNCTLRYDRATWQRGC